MGVPVRSLAEVGALEVEVVSAGEVEVELAAGSSSLKLLLLLEEKLLVAAFSSLPDCNPAEML